MLMCCFHVTSNIKKHFRNIRNNKSEETEDLLFQYQWKKGYFGEEKIFQGSFKEIKKQYSQYAFEKNRDGFLCQHKAKKTKNYFLTDSNNGKWHCNCPFFVKWKICKHIPMLLKKLNIAQDDIPDIRSFASTRKRKNIDNDAVEDIALKGRRRQARKALEIDEQMIIIYLNCIILIHVCVTSLF
ncbi:hypothetical protein ROZALSC1DRAFT_23292 [Rozella allomycis CSF55]|uniref:SWIM-type domain-containing protein n=1 Tax=Rozella allomycis (strain CSF55) TaxID=988480 RepID=A0A4P9YGQ2_ROZAC|nr:hypothetical protein ROZALSC1DRAFT_23292 [Rozella allomycis CSF55]